MQLLGPRPSGLTRSQPVFALHGPNAATELGSAALLQVGSGLAPLSVSLKLQLILFQKLFGSNAERVHPLAAGRGGYRCTAADAAVGSRASEAARARRCWHCRQHSSAGAAVQGGADGSGAAPTEPGAGSSAGTGGGLVEPCRFSGVWCKMWQHICDTVKRAQHAVWTRVQLLLS